MMDFDTKAPRVDAIIDEAERRSGVGKENAFNSLFCMADQMQRLARQLEIELNQANEKIAELQKLFDAHSEARKKLKQNEIAYYALMEKIQLKDFMKGLE